MEVRLYSPENHLEGLPDTNIKSFRQSFCNGMADICKPKPSGSSTMPAFPIATTILPETLEYNNFGFCNLENEPVLTTSTITSNHEEPLDFSKKNLEVSGPKLISPIPHYPPSIDLVHSMASTGIHPFMKDYPLMPQNFQGRTAQELYHLQEDFMKYYLQAFGSANHLLYNRTTLNQTIPKIAADSSSSSSVSKEACDISLPSTSTSSGNKRKRASSIPDDQKDEYYWERRKKNNEAAKRSRDARRRKEEETNQKMLFFEKENYNLKLELIRYRLEIAELRSEYAKLDQQSVFYPPAI